MLKLSLKIPPYQIYPHGRYSPGEFEDVPFLYELSVSS
jgi:hypothetical protein